ncbi:hypothetical protein ACJIZ3_023512 [Penstemon smallii]|uniref:DNA2/NAM7 helicase-like C-terminal domain-containing protein n=1 Tax=Penstemon smallii TaxID=265156 RepID=A0ABD3TQN9_9LAMI
MQFVNFILGVQSAKFSSFEGTKCQRFKIELPILPLTFCLKIKEGTKCCIFHILRVQNAKSKFRGCKYIMTFAKKNLRLEIQFEVSNNSRDKILFLELFDTISSEGSRMIKPSIFRINAFSHFKFTCPSLTDLEKDPMQLGPVVFCKDAEIGGLGTSYMERLLESELYANGNKIDMSKLIRNYRTHPAILYLTSRLFYDWGLMTCKEENLGFTTSMDDLLPNKEFHLLFVGMLDLEEQESSNLSWFNRYEASRVVNIIRVLIEKKGLKEKNVGVITPYRQQVLKIRGALKSFPIPNIKLGEVSACTVL